MNPKRDNCTHPDGLDYCAASFDEDTYLYWSCPLCFQSFDDLPDGARARRTTSPQRDGDG